MKIGIGTVIRLKKTGDHVYSHGIIIYDYSCDFGGRRILGYDPELKKVDFMGYSLGYILNSEIIGKENIKFLTYYNGITKMYYNHKAYMDFIKSGKPINK